MSNDTTIETAVTVNALLSKILRRLNRQDINDPIIELPLAQMRVCSALFEKPRTMSCLSKELGVSLSAITQLADRLEKADLVERYTEPGDLRVKKLQLSRNGEGIMRARRNRRAERLIKVLENIPHKDRDMIAKAFQKLYDASLAID
jgi:DNA-binding MarR family transcriptional regulator